MTLKLLERQKKNIYKASQNIIKAIEQGIITDMTKERLLQLETQLAEIEIEINKEKTIHVFQKKKMNTFY